jgi:hypothetical protein
MLARTVARLPFSSQHRHRAAAVVKKVLEGNNNQQQEKEVGTAAFASTMTTVFVAWFPFCSSKDQTLGCARASTGGMHCMRRL